MNRFTKQTASTILSLACTFTLWMGTSTLIQLSAPTEAQACRDCPFPTPMASLHWRLPSGNSDVTVQEINLGGGRVQSVVRLIDAHTGELLAIGKIDHARGRKRLQVELRDMTGGRMEAHLFYQDAERTKVRIRITCLQCSLTPSYLN